MKFSTVAGLGFGLFTSYQTFNLASQSDEMNESMRQATNLLGQITKTAFEAFCLKIALDVAITVGTVATVVYQTHQQKQRMISAVKDACDKMRSMNEKMAPSNIVKDNLSTPENLVEEDLSPSETDIHLKLL